MHAGAVGVLRIAAMHADCCRGAVRPGGEGGVAGRPNLAQGLSESRLAPADLGQPCSAAAVGAHDRVGSGGRGLRRSREAGTVRCQRVLALARTGARQERTGAGRRGSGGTGGDPGRAGPARCAAGKP